jgi:large subunit ribosomal protein L21
MYAVIATGGKQYRVEPGDMIDIERLPGAAESAEVTFDQVLMVGGGDEIKVGSPTVDGAQVKAVRMTDVRGPKIIVFKMKKRKGYRRKNGHRQDLLRVRIQDIQV